MEVGTWHVKYRGSDVERRTCLSDVSFGRVVSNASCGRGGSEVEVRTWHVKYRASVTGHQMCDIKCGTSIVGHQMWDIKRQTSKLGVSDVYFGRVFRT